MPRVWGNHMSNHMSYHAEEIIKGKGYISISNREVIVSKKYSLVTVSLALIFLSYLSFSPYLKSIPSTLGHYSLSNYYYTWQPMNDYSFQK